MTHKLGSFIGVNNLLNKFKNKIKIFIDFKKKKLSINTKIHTLASIMGRVSRSFSLSLTALSICRGSET